MSKLGGEEVNRFQWLSHSTSTKEFLKRGREKRQIGQS